MSVFKRVFTWGKSETHALLDKIENPIKMAEQGVRDLKQDLNSALESFAQVKAQGIRSKQELEKEKEAVASYEKKAMLLLQRAEQGGLDPSEADRLAGEALQRKDHSMKRVLDLTQNETKHNAMTQKLEMQIKELRSQINNWENELKTLRARYKVANATKKINKQLSQVDSSSTLGMLEKMKEKATEEEALSDAYVDIASTPKSIDSEINQILGSSVSTQSSLDELKAKMKLKSK